MVTDNQVRMLESSNHPAAALVTKLAVLCREQKRYDEVEPEFAKVLDSIRRMVGAKQPLMLRRRAWLQATCPIAEFRDGPKALENATRACELADWKDYRYFGTLAASYAEVGDFNSAVKWQKEAVDSVTEDTSAESRSNYESRLNLYQSGKPYRQSP
ncbi:MAG: hypothetical protein JSW66_05205 [Phycisphaerales bacterium]|nr:MAG: hypothetical protein JSW66_05205 [Phycisphaerales bacterium]